MDRLLESARAMATPGPYHQCNIYVEPFSDGDKPDPDVEAVLLEHRSLQSLFRELVWLRERETRLEIVNGELRRQAERLQQENGRFKSTSAKLDTWRVRLLTELETEKIRFAENRKLAPKGGKLRSLPAVEAPPAAENVATPALEEESPQAVEGPDLVPTAEATEHLGPAEPTQRDIDHNAIVRVLHYATPSPQLLPYSLSFGTQSPWCKVVRTLKSLSLVRKAWHDAATPHLYSDIVLRRAGQVVALARTVRSSPLKFGIHIRSITLSCEVPEYFLRITRDSLADIIDHCSNLTSMSFQEAFPTAAILGPAYLPALFTSFAGDGGYINLPLPGKIQYLALHDDRYAEELKPGFLSLSKMELPLTNLVSLSIYTGSSLRSAERTELLFPSLETVTFWSTPTNEHFHIPHWWNTPKLKSLRFRPELTLRRGTVNELGEFIAKHRLKLINVDFGGNVSWPPDNTKFGIQVQTLDMCPNLEHVVLRVASPEHLKILKKSPFFSRPIEHVDLIVKGSLRPAPSATKSLRHHEGSSWKYARYLDLYLLRWIPGLPYIFPPEHDVQDTRVHIQDYYGLWIKECPGEIALYHSPLYGKDQSNIGKANPLGVGDSDDDDNDDPDYRPSSSPASSDYGSSDLSDIEPDEPEDLYMLPSYGTLHTRQFTEDEALTIYFSTL